MRFKPLAANDIFISYPRKDATTYAEGLATKLNEKNLSCFTDTLGTDAGKDLPEGLIRELKSCKMLVVLCSETTGQSYVTTEISTYIEAKGSSRTIVPVVFDKTVMNEKWYSAIEGIAAVFEPGEELVTGNPSDAVVNRIDKAFTYSRSKERLRKYTIGASVVLAVLLVLIGVASLIAVLQLREAKTQGQEAAAQILSANAVSNLDIDPEVSLLLATRAVETRDNAQSATALRRALVESHVRKLLRGHTNSVYEAEFSRDGNIVVTTSEDGTARVWDVSTGNQIKELKTEDVSKPNPLRVAEFSKDGKFLVAVGGGIARVWNALSWEPLYTVQVSDRQVNSLTFTPDGKHFATGSGPKLRLWDIVDGRLFDEIPLPGQVDKATFSSDGKLVLVAFGDAVRLIDVVTKKEVAEFKEPAAFEEFGATFSPDDKLVIITGSKTPWIYEVSTKRKIAELHGHTDQVFDAEFSPDGLFLVTVSADTTARVWDTEGWQSVLVLRGHTGMVFGAAFSPDSKSVVTTSEDHTARIWDVRVGQLAVRLRGHSAAVRYAEFSRDGKLALTAGDDNTPRVWDVSTQKLVTALVGHMKGIREAAFNRDGTLIVTASEDGTARVWEARTGRTTLRLEHKGVVSSVEFSTDGDLIATASEDGVARLWNAATGELTAQLKPDKLSDDPNPTELRAFRLSPDGNLAVTISPFSAWIWDVHTHQALAPLSMPPKPGLFVDGGMKLARFSPDGSRIVIGNEAGRVGVWNKKGEFLFELEGHEQYINSISFNHDGSLIATASADESARVWDASNGKSLFTMKGPKGDFRYADFSSDDRYIVTSNQNNAAWVWDRIAKKSVIQLVGSNNAINVAKFGPDGKLILAGSQDQHAYLYNCEVCDSPQNLLELARKRVTRPLRPEEQETYSR